jgi:hypothetical protein
MKYLIDGILIIFLAIVLSSSAICEVTKLSINTDSSWKCIDFEQDGWNAEDYDDSWWEAVQVYDGHQIDQAVQIWYPANAQTMPHTAYFRKIYEIDGSDILSAKIYVGSNDDYNHATVDLFINNNPLEKITANYYGPAEVDITPYLKPGKNILAAKVVATDSIAWAMSGLVRYNKITATSPIPSS